jgi:hypothetical protein
MHVREVAPVVWSPCWSLEGVTYCIAGVAILLACLPHVARAQVNCEAIPVGPARTDCYIGLSRVYQGQSDAAAGKARVQSDIARHRQVTGTSGPKHGRRPERR